MIPEPVVTPVIEHPDSVERWRELVCSYGWDCEWALYVVRRESNGDPEAYNYTPIYNAGIENHTVCLFQLAIPLHDRFFAGDWRDPKVCVDAAWGLYQEQGVSPWRLN